MTPHGKTHFVIYPFSQELNMYEINLRQNGKHNPSYISVIVYTNDKDNHN